MKVNFPFVHIGVSARYCRHQIGECLNDPQFNRWMVCRSSNMYARVLDLTDLAPRLVRVDLREKRS